MSKTLSKLKGYNIVALFYVNLGVSFLCSLAGLYGGVVAKVLSLVLVFVAFLTHSVLASKAVLEDKRTFKILNVFYVALFLALVNTICSYFSQVSILLGLGSAANCIFSIAPTLFYLAGYILGYKSLKFEYRTSWYLATAMLISGMFTIINSLLIGEIALAIILLVVSITLIILLIINLSKVQKQENMIAANQDTKNNYSLENSSIDTMSDTISKINTLKTLYDSGVLTEEEYVAEKDELINKEMIKK